MSHILVTCNLSGGLGNQLFQIFAVTSYALTHKIPFAFIDLDVLRSLCTIRHTYWNTFLNGFNKLVKPSSFFEKRLHKMEKIKEQSFSFVPIDAPAFVNKDLIVLHGYYQSYKYFDKHFEIICNRLLRLEEKQESVRKFLPVVKDKDKDKEVIVSMHFRLGDYKKYPETYVLQPVEYYQKALSHIVRALPKDSLIKVIYFCEDEDFEEVQTIIANHFLTFKDESKEEKEGKGENITMVRANSSASDWEQLLMMSLCDHHIIANSTFSWWGAYLNVAPTKIVCYPENWFAPEFLLKSIGATGDLLEDLCPPLWTKI